MLRDRSSARARIGMRPKSARVHELARRESADRTVHRARLGGNSDRRRRRRPCRRCGVGSRAHRTAVVGGRPRADRIRYRDRLPPARVAPRVRDAPRRHRRVHHPRIDVPARARSLVGGDPPAAPRDQRAAGRPALAVREGRAFVLGRARLLAFAHRLAVRSRKHRLDALRPRVDSRPDGVPFELLLLPVGRARTGDSRRDRRRGARHLAGRGARLPVGRPAPRIHDAAVHLVHQFGLPHLRRPAVRMPRRGAQQHLRRAADDGRGMAQQPSHVSEHCRRTSSSGGRSIHRVC